MKEVHPGVPSTSANGAWLNIYKGSSKEGIKLGGMYMKNLSPYTHFSGKISGGIECQAVVGLLQKNTEVEKLTLWCADASIALQNKDRNFFAQYNILISEGDIKNNRLDVIFEYSKNQFDFYLQGTAEFAQNTYSVKGGARYDMDRAMISGGIKYDSALGSIVPTFGVKYTL